MPVSENEETGVKCALRLSSFEISGVPIKKRRFFRPSSPQPEEQAKEESSGLSANTSPRNDNGNVLEDLSSNVSAAECSFDANNDSVCEENKERSVNVVQTNKSDCPKGIIEESSSGNGYDPLHLFGTEEKLQAAIESSIINSGIAASDISVPDSGKEIKGLDIGDGNVAPGSSTVSENATLELAPKEQDASSSKAHNNVASNETQQIVKSVSLNLTLSMGEQDSKGKPEDLPFNSEQANRSNWDLNTTMDAWEGSSTDMTADKIVSDTLNTGSGSANLKNLLVAESSGGKQLLDEGSRSRFTVTFSETQFNAGDSLNLGLSPFLSLNSGEESSGSVAPKSLRSVVPNTMLTYNFTAQNDAMVVNPRTIKSEPLDASLRHDFGESLLGDIKPDIVEKFLQEGQRLPSSCAPNLDSISIKTEPFIEGSRQSLKNVEGASEQFYKSTLQDHVTEGNSISSSEKQVFPDQGAISEFPCSKDKLKDLAMTSACSENKISVEGTELKHSEDAKPGEEGDPMNELPKYSDASGLVEPVVHHANESSIPTMINNSNSEKNNVNNLDCRPKFTTSNVLDSHGIGDGLGSDEEKINLSGNILEQDGRGYECGSDGNSMRVGREEDHRLRGFEDGEVQGTQLGSATGVNPEKGEDTCGFDSMNENRNFPQLPNDKIESADTFREDGSWENTVETGKDSVKEFNDTFEHAGEHISVQEHLVVGNCSGGVGENEGITGQPVHNLGNVNSQKGEWTEQASDHVHGVGQLVETPSPGSCGDMVRNDEGVNDSVLPKAETSLNVDDSSKDANAGGNRSRIINLSRASNATSSSRPLSSRPERERLPDTLLERDQLHSRGRDEVHDDVTWKLSRERYQDQPCRNSRFNFSRGRGRLSNRIVSFRGDRNPERDYNSNYRNSISEYGIPRNKYVLAEPEAEFGNYNVGADGNFAGAVRPGRKIMDGDSSVFRHQQSRKRSPGWRDGPSGRSLQIVRRTPRNIGEEGSEGVGLTRHDEKFMRGFSGEGQDHTFTRSQTSYKGIDNQYVQGSRIVQGMRRPHSYIRSKSPIRSRSPGLWPSRRRSPDVFGGHVELPHQRSPIYRERMRSPDHHPVFQGEVLVRRHGSPQYLTRANELNDMDPGHLRSAISNRSPNGRVFPRNSRRYGFVDPRERIDGDDFFGGPVHSGRFNELGDESSEDRRRISDRRLPMRSFRPPFSGTDGENFHLNAEDRPRPFRFHLNAEDPQFREGGSFRDNREYERRNKDRPGNVPRRPRGIEG